MQGASEQKKDPRDSTGVHVTLAGYDRNGIRGTDSKYHTGCWMMLQQGISTDWTTGNIH